MMAFRPIALCLLLGGCVFGPDAATQRATIDAMNWKNADQPLVVLDVPARKTVAVLGLAGVNGGALTWASGDRRGVVEEDGIIRRSAGFGADLMATDPAPVLAALAGGNRTYQRDYRHMTADNRIVASQHSCAMSGPVEAPAMVVGQTRTASLWTETCDGPDGTVTNRYWRDGTRAIRTEQWLSGPLGTVTVEFPTDRPETK